MAPNVNEILDNARKAIKDGVDQIDDVIDRTKASLGIQHTTPASGEAPDSSPAADTAGPADTAQPTASPGPTQAADPGFAGPPPSQADFERYVYGTDDSAPHPGSGGPTQA